MPPAPLSVNEPKRLAALQKVRLLGTPAEERFDKITRLARRLFNAPMAAIALVGEKMTWLKSVQGFDSFQAPRAHSYCAYTVLKDEVCLVRDARLDPRVLDNPFAPIWVFYAGVPLHFEGERVGALCIGDDKPRDLSAEELDGLRDLAALAEQELQVASLSEAQIALALSNEELDMKARVDVLTRVWNRGAILELAAREGAKAAEAGATTAILMIDIDHFKSINDTYGHPAGDEVLRVIAERLRTAVRTSDAVGRYGGEEFLALLPAVRGGDALHVSERILAALSCEPIDFEGTKLTVTCSIGCAISTDPRFVVEELCRRADSALYAAKAAGRNRVELSTTSPRVSAVVDVAEEQRDRRPCPPTQTVCSVARM